MPGERRMNTVVLKLFPFTDQQKLHAYMQKKMKFPSCYGRNLDALYDCLTDIKEDTAVDLRFDPENTLQKQVLTVFSQAVSDNRHLAIIKTRI